MVGDFNAHNKLWNCDKTDSQGEKLLNSIEIFNLFLHNLYTYSHIDAKQVKKSNINLIITSFNLVDKIDFSINNDTLGSDHFPIFISINTEKSAYSKKTFKIKTIKTDWQKFEAQLKEKYPSFLTNDYNKIAATEKYELFTSIITHLRSNKLDNPVSW